MEGYRPTRMVRSLTAGLGVIYIVGWVLGGVLVLAVPAAELGAPGFSLSVAATVDFSDARLQSSWTGAGDGISLAETDTTLRVPLKSAPVSFRIATYVIIAVGFAMVMLFLYHLRELFRRVRDGVPFDSGNAARLRWMGGLIVAAHVLGVVVSGWQGRVVLSTLTDASVRLRPSIWLDERLLFGFNEGLIVAALVLFALAEIFNRGAALEDEQSLVV